MMKVNKIVEIGTNYIICQLSKGIDKKVLLKPLLEKHSHLDGIKKLEDPNYIKHAKIGIFGEIFWKKTITSSSSEVWNYDFSPEYIMEFGLLVQ